MAVQPIVAKRARLAAQTSVHASPAGVGMAKGSRTHTLCYATTFLLGVQLQEVFQLYLYQLIARAYSGRLFMVLHLSTLPLRKALRSCTSWFPHASAATIMLSICSIVEVKKDAYLPIFKASSALSSLHSKLAKSNQSVGDQESKRHLSVFSWFAPPACLFKVSCHGHSSAVMPPEVPRRQPRDLEGSRATIPVLHKPG